MVLAALPGATLAAGQLTLLNETLRVPFGEDSGGETHYFVRFNRLDVGVFARV